MNDVGLLGQVAEFAQCRQGESGGCNLQIQLGLVGSMATQIDRLLCGIRTQRKNVGTDTEVGDTAVGVKINGELKPMRTRLQNGDVVEIIRGAKREVPTDWRSLTVTGRAPSANLRSQRTSKRHNYVHQR